MALILQLFLQKAPSQVSDGFYLRLNIYAYIYKYMRASCQNIFHIKPTLARNVRQSLHRQFVQFNFFILSLNIKKDADSLISCGTKFHSCGPQ